ncbi:MAG: glycosyltransferase family 1 protein [Calothrix sp. C42_A2020_038]|nr:glycosyltransferase family 1 protein [Calothrix sp. C42_A2020_038]
MSFDIHKNSYSGDNARILVASMRGFNSEVFRSPEFEFEDAICQFDHVDMLVPVLNLNLTSTVRKRVANYISIKTAKKELLTSGCTTSYVKCEYDLFFFICQHFWDITCINSILGWREKCHQAVLWLDEIWVKELSNPKTKLCLELLKNFDYIFTTQTASAKAITDLINRPCYSLPYGVDAIQFCPVSIQPERSIDIYSIGRRSPIIHQALLEFSEQKNLLYLYDTLKGLQMNNYKEHRKLYSNLIKRSRYFIANKAKFDTPEQTGGQEEIGSRFFEGAAGGAVMIGIPPNNEAFNTIFDWNDAIIPIGYDTSNLSDIITELDKQPERLHQIRENNIVNTLLRNDWVYRWEKVLEKVGLHITPKMISRKNYLHDLAKLATTSKIMV